MNNIVRFFLQGIESKFNYRPLPKYIRQDALDFYKNNLNGFDKTRSLEIKGVLFARRYNRIVIGDYGAWVEIEPDDILQPLHVPSGQEWRLDARYCTENNISLKYHWYEYQKVKVYRQFDTVKYADYVPGKFYVSVLDFDEVPKCQ